MNLLYHLKIFLMIVAISSAKVFSEIYQGENFFLSFVSILVFWIVLLIFMDFREWFLE